MQGTLKMRPASGNDLKTVLLHRTAFLCVSRFLRLASFGTVNALMIAISVTFQPLFSVIPKICSNFAQLVMQHYNQTRNVAWYAEKLQITHAHLCTTVKQITGKTCVDIISSMVIMDAKSQLKSSQLSIQNISDSLNFANVSFFGKYFKRYVGMSPLEYRNNG